MQTEIRSLFDCHVVGSDGQSIGQVGQVFLNERSGRPEWVTVRTGLFGMRQTFVPLASSRRTGEEIRVPFDKETIKGAPNIDVDDHLTLKEEAELYRYYGLQPSNVPQQRAASPTGERRPDRGPAPGTTAPGARTPPGTGPQPGTGPRPGAEGMPGASDLGDRDLGDRDLDMTASEERLRIGKETTESGQIRLRKYVETENVQQRMPLSHEEAVIEREPIREGETVAPYEIGEEEQRMTLHEERPVIGKETRPVEHVRVRKETVQHEETVQGQVRRERIEVDESDVARNRGRRRNRGDQNPPPRR
ncbi:MAG TPA: DUF2382 domain-containing protein [Nonomuraea sp.]|nr:DUF2382 domain-containing protein [Nonomuraea sp.]